MKHFFNLTVASIIFILFVLGCSQTSTNPQNTASNQTQNVPSVAVSANQLTKEYDENELAADGKYKGKTLEVSGKISDIAETFGNLTVQLEGFKQSGMNLLSVMCSFSESEKQAVSKLKKGQQVTLIGVGDGKTGGLYVGLNNCRIK